MNRRQFLGIAGGVGGLTMSGCLGYEIRSSSELDEMETQLTEQEDRINELESELEQRNQRVQELEDEVERLENEISTLNDQQASAEDRIAELEEQRESAIDKIILNLYSRGVSSYNTGFDRYNSGTSYWNNDDYRAARAEFNVAGGQLREAELAFSLARERASQYERTGVTSYCRSAVDHAGYFATGCADYQQACFYAVQGDIQQANRTQSDAEASLSQADGVTLSDLGVLEEELGTQIST